MTINVKKTISISKNEKLTLKDLRDFVVETGDAPADAKVTVNAYDSQREGYSITVSVTL